MTFEDIMLSVVSILAISFSSGIVAARSFATRNRHRVDANRALIGFSAANVAVRLFGGFPVTAPDDRGSIGC
jgi:MFS superfamily sulfate permease-like transporter